MSAREALAARKPRVVKHAVWVEDPSEPAARLQDAKARLLMSGIGKSQDDPIVVQAQAHVDEAQAEVDACRHWLVFHGLRGDKLERLIAEHPAPADAPKGDVYDKVTFFPALLEACTQDSDLTAEEWAEHMASLAEVERKELTDDVWSANTTTWSESVPKD